MNGDIIERAKEYIASLLGADAGGHDPGHALRVYGNALRIREAEGEGDEEIIALAALLHDADDHKLFRTENDENARRFLSANGVPPKRADRICEAIDGVSFSRNRGRRPASIEGRIVQDADRLDAIGAVGIARAFAFGGARGRRMSDSVRHFHEKLLLLKDEMNTQTGRAMAEARHAFMLAYLEELAREWGEDP